MKKIILAIFAALASLAMQAQVEKIGFNMPSTYDTYSYYDVIYLNNNNVRQCKITYSVDGRPVFGYGQDYDGVYRTKPTAYTKAGYEFMKSNLSGTEALDYFESNSTYKDNPWVDDAACFEATKRCLKNGTLYDGKSYSILNDVVYNRQLIERGKYALALKIFDYALSIPNGGNAEEKANLWDSKGEVYIAQNNRAQARVCYNKAKSIYPDYYNRKKTDLYYYVNGK